jgi:MFS family permease
MILGFLCGNACQDICEPTLGYAMILMLGGLNFGYTMAYGLPASTSIHETLGNSSSKKSQWFTLSTPLAAIAGPAITGISLHWVGRRTLTIVYGVAAAAVWLLFLWEARETQFPVFIVARGLSGLVTGAFSALIPMYLVEISPPQATGFFGTLNQLGIAAGWVVCYTAAIPLGDHRALAVIGAVFPALLAILVLVFVPADAVREEVDPLMLPDDDKLLSPRWLWWLFVCTLLMLFQQTTGINVVLMYLTQFFEGPDAQSDDFNLFASSLSSIAQVVSCLFGAFLIAKFGRRFIWMISMVGIGVTDLWYAVEGTHNWVGVVVTFVFLLSFGFGAGPIPWFFPAERFPGRLRPTAMAIIATMNWVFAFVIIGLRELVPSLAASGRVTTWLFSVFTLLSFAGALFGYYFVVNTQAAAKKDAEIVPNIFNEFLSE